MERPLSVCPIPGRGGDGTPTTGAPGGVGPRYGPIPGRGTEGTCPIGRPALRAEGAPQGDQAELDS